MSLEVTIQTINRGIDSVLSGHAFKEGGNYLKNNVLKDWFLYLVTLGTYTAKAKPEIEHKEQTLQAHSVAFAEAIINARPDVNGNYDCNVTINDTIDNNLVSTTFRIQYNSGFRKISIADQSRSSNVLTHSFSSFTDLKKALLNQYIKEQRDLGNREINLERFDLSDIDLSEPGFLKDTVLSVENLRAIIASRGNLIGAKPIAGIPINDLSFRGIKMDCEMLCSLALLNANLVGVDLSNQDLESAPLKGLDLSEANFTNAKLKLASFNDAKLNRAIFIGADLTYASFVSADLTDIITNAVDILDEATYSSSPSIISRATEFLGADFRYATIGTALDQVALKDSVLSVDLAIQLGRRRNNELIGFNLSGKGVATNDFSGRDFTGFNLTSSNFKGTNCKGTIFTNAKLVNANMSNVKMDGDTELTDTDLTGANFDSVDLRLVPVRPTTKIEGILVNRAKLSREWVEAAIQNGVSIKGANLEGVDLSGLDLSEIDVTNVNFKGAKFFRIENDVIHRTKLSTEGLVQVIRSRKEKNNENNQVTVDLKGIDLSGTKENPRDLSESDFTNADLTDAKVDHCIFRYSQLDGCNLTRVDLTTASLAEVPGDPEIIVSDDDRTPFIEQLKNRLNFIISGEKNGDDPFYAIPNKQRKEMRDTQFFSLTDITLRYGDTFSDKGTQKIVGESEFDDRAINTLLKKGDNERTEAINDAANKLLRDGFNDEQKTLFHWSRAIMWSAKYFSSAAVLYSPELIEDRPVKQKEAQFRSDIYLCSNPEKRRMAIQALTVCFDTALAQLNIDYPNALNDEQIGAVRELFTSTRYAW